MVIKVLLLVVFFVLMVGIGIYCRKNATDVNGFVLGGRSQLLSLSAMQVSSAGNTVLHQRGSVSAMQYSVRFLHGLFSADEQEL